MKTCRMRYVAGRRTMLAVSTTLILSCGQAWAQEATGTEPAQAGDATQATQAQTACEADLGGSLRSGYWTRPADFGRPDNPVMAALWGRGRWRCGAQWGATLEGVGASDDALRGRSSSGRVREAFLDWRGEGPWSLRAGRQVIVWGKADRLNPTDNLTPRNYTRLVSEETDQRDGVDAVSLSHRSEENTITALVTAPRFRPHTVPIDLPAGLRKQEVPTYGAQTAIKFDRAGGDVDWSMSWLHGFDLMPSYGLGATPQGSPLLKLRHPRVDVLGADAASVVGRYGLRAEAAYTWVDRDGPEDVFTRRSMFYAVVGGDRTFADNFNTNLQLFWRHIPKHQSSSDFPDPGLRPLLVQAMASWNQTRRDQYGMSIRLANKWLNETVEAELAGVVSFVANEYALRPRLVWRVSDRFKLTLGADYFEGAQDTFFGQIKDLSSVFVEGQLGF